MKILLIGSGYLGTILAPTLKRAGHSLILTTTTPEKIPLLQAIGHYPVIWNGADRETLHSLISECDGCIVTVAPKSDSKDYGVYEEVAYSMAAVAPLHPGRFLIYTSSTSVYAEEDGNSVTESSPLSSAPSAQVLIRAEKSYLDLKKYGWRVCIFRLSEIFGPGRSLEEKAEKISGRLLAGGGERFANLIHVLDIARAVEWGLTQPMEGVFNLSDGIHETRKTFYERICHASGLPLPHFDPSQEVFHGKSKRVSSDKIIDAGFTFQHTRL